jgi:dipeptidyl aminopeptidase/acylaminoacyl peptidase
MADERLQAAIRHWAGRFIANGIDYNDFVRTTGSISSWDDWLEAWTRTAEMHIELAEAALERDAALSAGQAYLRAAVSYHFSKFVWVLDPELNRRNTLAAVSTLYKAHRLLEPEAERIEIATDSARAAANLRRPAGGKAAPLVVLIPGLDSTKEEFWHWESVFLERGMATLSLDGPGQGEIGLTVDIRPDYELPVSAALDALSGRDDIDLSRVGAAGVSLGGHYVVRAAAFEPRLRAVAGISGPYDFGTGWEAMPELTREAVRHYTGAADMEEARERASALNLRGVAERVRQPCLVVTGRLDRVIGWEETKRIADAVPGAEWVLYEDGTHVCNNIPYKYRPLVADWMRARLQ